MSGPLSTDSTNAGGLCASINLPVPVQYSGAPVYTFRMRQMKVDKVGINLLTHDPVVILKDLEGKRYLPIQIGPFEATAIALALEGTQVPRPLSHDLMRTMLESLHATLEQIVIHDIKDSTFFAKLVVRQNGNTQEIDARPSDGIALALRMQAPIYVSDKIELEEFVPTRRPKPRTRRASRSSWKNSNRATSKGSPRVPT